MTGDGIMTAMETEKRLVAERAAIARAIVPADSVPAWLDEMIARSRPLRFPVTKATP